jgi:DNA-3-methyladenine glycosylase II
MLPRLLNRLSAAYGPVVQEDATPAHAFPRPEDLAVLVPEVLRTLGFSRQKARALIELAQAIAEQRFDPEGFASLTDEVAVSRLSERRGVGRWTAEYVLLRGLGRLHVFPGDDVGARNHLQRWLGMAEPLDYEGVRRTLADWQGFGGLIYFHLLLQGLAERGHLVNIGGG